MQCPQCDSTHSRKNGSRKGKQRYICADCKRQFLAVYEPPLGYGEKVKQECLKLYVNGMGLRAIERVKQVHHTTIGLWVKQVGQTLPDAPPELEIPEVTEQGRTPNLCRLKKNKIWLQTAVNHFQPGILAWMLGDRSSETFKRLWQIVYCWHSYFYVTDGYKVYRSFIDDADSFVDKTYMTRVESENTRLRHYLARL